METSVAYPTLALFSLGMFFILSSIFLRLVYGYNLFFTIPISIMANYILFPVIHDGSHKTISNNDFYNDLVGYIAGVPFFFAPFPAWRFVHLRHHQFTNIPDKDPDYYAGGNITNKWHLLFRWTTHIFNYIYYFFNETMLILYGRLKKKIVNNKRCDISNLKEITTEIKQDITIKNKGSVLVITTGSILFNLYITYYLYTKGYFLDVMILWIIPSAIAIIILSVLFDYLPHRYYETDIRDNKYAITNMTHGLFSTDGEINKWVALLTFNQLTYHNIHHLYPRVPFYKYPQIWKEKKDILLERGTPVQSIF